MAQTDVDTGIQVLKERDFVPSCVAAPKQQKSKEAVSAKRKKATATKKRKPVAASAAADGLDDDDDDGEPLGKRRDTMDLTQFVITEATKIVEEKKSAAAAAHGAEEDDIGSPGCDDATYRNTAINSLHYGVEPSEEVIARRIEELKKRDEGIVSALMFQAAIDSVLERLGLAPSEEDQDATDIPELEDAGEEEEEAQ